MATSSLSFWDDIWKILSEMRKLEALVVKQMSSPSNNGTERGNVPSLLATLKHTQKRLSKAISPLAPSDTVKADSRGSVFYKSCCKILNVSLCCVIGY